MAHTNGIIEIDQVPYGIGGEPGRSDSPHTMRTVTNPMARPYDFKWNGKDYRIKAGETQHLPEFLSFHAARGIAKEILAEQRAPKDLTVRMVLYTENDVVKVMQELIDVNTAPSRAVKTPFAKTAPKTKMQPIKKIEEISEEIDSMNEDLAEDIDEENIEE